MINDHFVGFLEFPWVPSVPGGMGFRQISSWPVRIHASTLTAMTYAKSLTMTYQSFIEVPAFCSVITVHHCSMAGRLRISLQEHSESSNFMSFVDG